MTPVYPPGPEAKPIIGHVREFRLQRLDFLMACRQQYGELVHLRLGPRHAYLVSNTDDIRAVLVEQADKLHKTPLFKKHTASTIGEGLLTSEGDFHRQQRRLVQPAFHHQRIAAYGDTMVQHTLRMLDSWHEGEARDLHHDMTRLTLGIVSETLFGADISSQQDIVCAAITDGIRRVAQRTMSPLSLPEWVPTPANLRSRRYGAALDRVVMGMIEERRKSGEDRGDLLSMLLLAVDEEGSGRGMSDQQARDEAMTLFIAGHETTANALVWALILLGQHPAAAETLYAEIDSVLAGRAPTVQDLPKLPYTEMVVKEALRLYPPAWVIPRLVVDALTLSGYPIAPESILLISPYVLHREARVFPDPERFMPERFAPSLEAQIPRYAYLPFGAGPRICIGNSFAMMEARLILATLAQHYRLDLLPGQDFTPGPMVTLRPRYPVLARFVSRVSMAAGHAEWA